MRINRPERAPELILDATDARGIPAQSHCTECGETWKRPASDVWAESMVRWGQLHLASHLRDTVNMNGTTENVDG